MMLLRYFFDALTRFFKVKWSVNEIFGVERYMNKIFLLKQYSNKKKLLKILLGCMNSCINLINFLELNGWRSCQNSTRLQQIRQKEQWTKKDLNRMTLGKIWVSLNRENLAWTVRDLNGMTQKVCWMKWV
jgi:hypothetical protein